MQLTLPQSAHFTTSIITRNLAKVEEILGKDRIRLYAQNGMCPERTIDYYKGRIRNQGIEANVRGYEFQYYFYAYLKALGFAVETEIPCAGTSIDILAWVKGLVLPVVQADGNILHVTVSGQHAFECKANSMLRQKAVRQIKQYSTKYNSHVYTLADTFVPGEVNSQIRRKGNITRSDLTYRGLVNRILGLQKLMRA